MSAVLSLLLHRIALRFYAVNGEDWKAGYTGFVCKDMASPLSNAPGVLSTTHVRFSLRRAAGR